MTKRPDSDIDTEAPTWESLNVDLPTRYLLHSKGVTPADVALYAEVGVLELKRILHLSLSGITGPKAMAYSIAGCSFEEMINLNRNRISPETLVEMRKLYPGVDPVRAVELKSSGLSKSLMAALGRMGVSDPKVMAAFSKSRITAKELDSLRKAGATLEDFDLSEPGRIVRPHLKRIALRKAGLPQELRPYLRDLDYDKMKPWDDEEIALAKRMLGVVPESWAMNVRYWGEGYAEMLIEIAPIATERERDDDYRMGIAHELSTIFKVVRAFELTPTQALLAWREYPSVLSTLLSLNSYGGSYGVGSEVKGQTFLNLLPKIKNVIGVRSDYLKLFGEGHRLIKYSSEIDRLGCSPDLYRYWVEEIWNRGRNFGAYPTEAQCAEALRKIELGVRSGVNPSEYRTMQELGIKPSQMLSVKLASEEVDRSMAITAAELDLSEAEEDEGVERHVYTDEWEEG